MVVQFTAKHYDFLNHVFKVMKSFYNKNYTDICFEIGKTYGAPEEDIKKAIGIFDSLPITAPVPAMVNSIVFISRKVMLNKVDVTQEPYAYEVDLEEKEWRIVSTVLDTYSRLLMGQFFVIYEQLDIPDNGVESNYDLVLKANHDARWNGVGVAQTRDLLIPKLKEMRLGWNGNFGIANADNAYNSKLAYEMVKVLESCSRYECGMLKVTDEPLIKIVGGPKIVAF